VEDDPTTQELRISQAEREQAEREHAQRSVDDEETKQHDRRAAKAAYLREKLEQRERAERDADR
jgi:hypothetical protein